MRRQWLKWVPDASSMIKEETLSGRTRLGLFSKEWLRDGKQQTFYLLVIYNYTTITNKFMELSYNIILSSTKYFAGKTLILKEGEGDPVENRWCSALQCLTYIQLIFEPNSNEESTIFLAHKQKYYVLNICFYVRNFIS